MNRFYVQRKDNYSIIPNHHLKNKKLSLATKGLFSIMLSLSDTGIYTFEGLEEYINEERPMISLCITELEKEGYISKMKNDEIYYIHEFPVLESNEDSFSGGQSFQMFYQNEATRRIKERDYYKSLIKENICYESLCLEMSYKISNLNEIVELILECVCSSKQFIRISGENIPLEVVKNRFLKLDSEHIRYVMDCLSDSSTRVKNIKQYLLTTLYNAPVTISNYYTALVNHDMYGGV